MSKREFISNIRLARNLFVHPRALSDAGLNDRTIATQLDRADIWLTPSSVEGFDADEFAELGSERRKELTEAVAAFEATARQVPPAEPATENQYRSAAESLQKIVEILDPYMPTREEATKVRKALQSVAFPNSVVNWDYELGSDADGRAAVWVTVFTDLPASSSMGRLVLDLTSSIRRALLSIGIDRWPYVRVRTVAEHMAR